VNKLVLPIVLIIIILVAGAGFLLFNKSSETPLSEMMTKQENEQTQESEFGTSKKSAHYETNTPNHGSTLAGVPINVVIDFNFDLAKPSEIKIEMNPSTGSGQVDYGVGETVIDENKLSMRRDMDPASPDGIYTVSYNACWPDRTCHDGYFEFAIDRSLESSYEDMTGESEITIRMSELMFVPVNLKISQGTKVTWVNDDGVEHFVNTDSHPAHTYFPEQNSKALGEGDEFSLTFDTSGIYPYHCSAHEASMKGSILVE